MSYLSIYRAIMREDSIFCIANGLEFAILDLFSFICSQKSRAGASDLRSLEGGAPQLRQSLRRDLGARSDTSACESSQNDL